MKKKPNNRKKILVIPLILLILAVASAVFVYIMNKNKNSDLSTAIDKETQTTSTAPTAQSDFDEGYDREDPGNTIGEDDGVGYITDNQGNIKNKTSEEKWIKSNSGEITLYSPVLNSKIYNGYEISGESTLPKISFRIIDDLTGVISVGELKVVSGKFSGTLDFKSRAKKGRVDIFGVRPDGTEFSNIEVEVIF